VFVLNIGIKFCGGCNPRYDRWNLVSHLKKIAPHHNYKSYSEGSSEVALVVCGCKRACANLENPDATNGIIIDDDSTIESVIEAIQISEK
jgi:hypothetical protein